MKPSMTMSLIQHTLGLAPVTAERIEGLISGRIHPDHFRSITASPMGTFDFLQQAEIQKNDAKIMTAINQLLSGNGVHKLAEAHGFGTEFPTALYVDREYADIPTVIFMDGEYCVMSIEEFVKRKQLA